MIEVRQGNRGKGCFAIDCTKLPFLLRSSKRKWYYALLADDFCLFMVIVSIKRTNFVRSNKTCFL